MDKGGANAERGYPAPTRGGTGQKKKRRGTGYLNVYAENMRWNVVGGGGSALL